MEHMTPEPKRRGNLRLWLGARYFRARRWAWWHTSGVKFARRRPGVECPVVCARHATPLMRKLKDVDMWLQENKVINLRLAAARLDGMVLLPGETFSYWRGIGNPTRRKGYVEGMMLKNGGFTAHIGGGLCQMSNLIYWMTLHTSLTVVERHRHGYDVFPDSSRTQPFGSGATCFYNYLDLMIRNDTDRPYLLHIRVGERDLEGEWRSDAPQTLTYQVYEAEHFMRGEYWGGYTRHNVIRRRVFCPDGKQVGDELVTENHAVMMYNPLLEEGAETASKKQVWELSD